MSFSFIINAFKKQGFRNIALLSLAETKTPFFSHILKCNKMPPESSILVATFPYTREFEKGFYAPFAQSNYYKELIARAQKAQKSLPDPFSSLSKKEQRFFSNSRLPEKELAQHAQLGFIGKNSLIITPQHGSRVLLMVWIFPLKTQTIVPPSPKRACQSCLKCEQSCPSKAILNGVYHKEACLQFWSTKTALVPLFIKESWQNRIYGCTICQDCCPFNQNIEKGISIERGQFPLDLDIKQILESKDSELYQIFKGTSLGMSWFPPYLKKRNAILVATYQRRIDLLPLIESYRNSLYPTLKDVAIWASYQLSRPLAVEVKS